MGAGWLSQGCPKIRPTQGERVGSLAQDLVGGRAGSMNSGYNGGPPLGGSKSVWLRRRWLSGRGGGYSGGRSGTHGNQAIGGAGSYCSGSSCSKASGGNSKDGGFVQIIALPNKLKVFCRCARLRRLAMTVHFAL